jgi:hypothetical protein
MILIFISNLIVGISSFLVNYRILKFKNFIDSLISLFILYFAQIVCTQLFLGIFGALYLSNVILLNSAILFIVWYITRNKKTSINFASFKDILTELLSNKVILLACALILGFGLVKVFINLINPPFGWDNLNYHFVFPIEWLKHGNFDTPITLCDDPSPSYYPINGSLFFLWFMLPLKNVFLADLGQVPFFILAFAAIYSISRKLALNRELSFYSAALFLITPNVFKQLEIAYVDVMFAACFFVGINFLLAFYREFSYKNLILWAISFGLFLGIKTSALIYGIFPVLFFIWILAKNAKKPQVNKIIICFLLFAMATILLGGFAYIRNFIYTGNPLYPADIDVFGKKFFKGVMPFLSYRAHWTKKDFNLEKFLFREGMGVQFILLVIPSIFLSIPFTFIKRKKIIDSSLVFILILPIALFISFKLFMPQFWVRYLYPFLGIAFIVVMYTLDLLNIPKRAIKIIVCVCLLASVGELSGHLELFCSFVLSALFFIFLPYILKLKFRPKHILAACILILFILHYLNFNYVKYEFDRYLSNKPFLKEDREAWKWLNDHTKGSRIAYTGIPLVLPLYGSNFKNDVFYVSVNKVYPVKLHYFPDGKYVWNKDYIVFHKSLEAPNNYRGNPDYFVWLSNLKKENIDYLVVYSLRMAEETAFPIENDWAKQHPGRFDSVFNKETVKIYRLRN